MNYQGISVFTEQPIKVVVENDKISAIKPLESSFGLPYIAPGFLDMQVNGYFGSDYSLEDFSETHLKNIRRIVYCFADDT